MNICKICKKVLKIFNELDDDNGEGYAKARLGQVLGIKGYEKGW